MCRPALSADVFGGFPADCRDILLPLITEQLKFHLEKEEELNACCRLLSDILEVLYRNDVVRIVVLLLYLLLFSLWANSNLRRRSRIPIINKNFDCGYVTAGHCAVLIFIGLYALNRTKFYSTGNLLTCRVGSVL